ncbi:hypothetical protein M409DRAFT_26336 [Zasmidium cellare ATCC 36951]|uniref:Uncharacterized protein n=1 Tax=Zasmidium cellare ATCC 36951 TaxID=1080233 RepID=A0A6A6C8D3_ZASCE|nr:uncharacterized protein M409DRAFT_26336 [Zasmidium cellare ATCC 36951]KAF2163295.1 hypothetical protein M409DRAFT_26336 [Zasmidium cellare ATCC 36951]
MRQKNWGLVYTDISNLALRRCSLATIRKHLKQQDFPVSDRSLRTKLKQWQLRQCDIDAALETSRPSTTLLVSQDVRRITDITQLHTEFRVGPNDTDPSECPSFDQGQAPSDQCARSAGLSLPRSGSHHVQAVDEIDYTDLRAIYHILMDSVFSGQSVDYSFVLRGCEFENGSESLLHYAIKQANWATKHQLEVVRRISQFVVESGYELNHTDAQGRTVVELAIASRSIPLLETVLGSGVSVNHANSEGDYPLHTAIRTRALPAIYKYLLRQGADANACASTGKRDPVATLTMPLGLVMMQLAAANPNYDGDTTAWFRIAGYLIEHGAICTPREMDRLLFHFAQAWHRNGGSANLWEDALLLLSALIKRGLSPTAALSDLGLPKCDCQSLAHLAFFHSRSEAFGRWLIEASRLQEYGTPLAQCLLYGCGDNFMPRPNVSNLLRVLMKRDSNVANDFNPIEYVLRQENHHSWEQKAAVVSTLLSLKAEQYIFESHDRQRHAAILEAVAACPFTPIKCKLAQELLQQRISSQVSGGRPEDLFQHPANRPFSTYFAEMVGQIDNLISHQKGSDRMLKALHQTLDYDGRHQKVIIGCFVHFLTASKIQAAESGNFMSKPRLYYLLELRREFELPDVPLPNMMILNMLKGVPEAYVKLKELEKFFAHGDIDAIV